MTDYKGFALLAVRAANAAGKPFGLDFFPRAFPNPLGYGEVSAGGVFDRIYQTNFWGNSESRSGVGSERRFAAAYVARLRKLLAERGLKSIFDAPCGDLNWILDIVNDPSISYIGGDISTPLIADLQRRFPNVDLGQFDITRSAFPQVDVWHCRDCLFHLPFGDIRSAFVNFVGSNIPFALLTTHKAIVHRNLDVEAGGFRYLDLERAPISLDQPLCYLRDFRVGRDFPRYVGLWSREQIEVALNR